METNLAFCLSIITVLLPEVLKTRAQTVELSPGPTVEVLVNTSLQLTCSTTYSMKFVFFRDSILLFGATAITIGNINGNCNKLTGHPEYAAKCNSVNGPYIFTINYVTLQHHNSKIKCIVQYGSSTAEDVASAETTILVIAPLETAELIPSGIITKNVSETQEFQCSATSLPRPSISWHIGNSTLTAAFPPEVSGTNDTIISRILYIADKSHDGRFIVCLVNYSNYSVSVNASLIIQFRPTVELYPAYDTFDVILNTTNIQLTCFITEANPNITSFRWYKDGSLISAAASITFPTIHKRDYGNYTCDATNIVGTSLPSSGLLLNVLYGAELISIGKQQPKEGETFTVACNGQANPVMTDNDTTWTKQNNNTFKQLGHQLIINSTKKVDKGTYICTVLIKLSSSTGQSIMLPSVLSFELDVLYRPVVSVSPNFNPYNVIQNTTDVQLLCKITEANPSVTSYRWYKDGSVVSTASTYNIPIVHKSDGANYTCDALNTVGYSYQARTITLNVLYGVELDDIDQYSPIEGQLLSITCSGRSNPNFDDSDVTWTKKTNNTFRHIGRILVINNVNRIDSGSFICNVVLQLKTSVGSILQVIGTTSVDVNVLYRPSVEVFPTYNPYDVVENTTNLKLICTVKKTNPPVSSYKWYKDGTVVSTNHIYTISIVQRSHSGRYGCDATNTAGSTPSTVIQLNVLYGITMNPIPSLQPLKGGTVIVTCKGSSNPPVENEHITWTKQNNNTFKQLGMELTLHNVNRQDKGKYICTMSVTLEASGGLLTNVTGTISVVVEVLFKPTVDESKPQTKTILAVKENETLFLQIHLIAKPLPLLQWSFINDIDIGKCNNNTVNSNDTFDGEHITSNIHIPNLQYSQLGEYILISKNHLGVFSRKYTVVLQGKPSPSMMVNTFCKSTTASIFWIPGFDGGRDQDFHIVYWEMDDNTQSEMSKSIPEIKTHRSIIYQVSELKSNTKYTFSIISKNEYGNVSSGFVGCLTDDFYMSTKKENVGNDDMVLKTGIGMLVVASVALIAVTSVIVVWRIRNRNMNSSSRAKEYVAVEMSNPNVSTSYDSINVGNDTGKDSQVNKEGRTSICSLHDSNTTTYDDVEKETAVKQPIMKTKVEQLSDRSTHIYESMTKLASDNTSTSDPCINQKLKVTKQAKSGSQPYEVMNTPP